MNKFLMFSRKGHWDVKIDEVDENGELKTHHGKAFRKRDFDN